MSLTTCNILISQQSERTVTVTRSLSKLLQLNTSRTITVRLGNKSSTHPVKVVNRKGYFVVLPHAVASQIRLPSGGKCMVKSNTGKDLQFGPLIGIMTSTSNNPVLPFGSRTGFVKEFLRAASNKFAYYFVFSPRNVNWDEEVVTGYFPSSGGRWVRKTVPLPDVIYNRLPSRSAEKSISMEDFKEKFVRRNIPIFNWSFFDKSDVYRLLAGDEANEHVPESHNRPTSQIIRTMMEKHRFVYLKPTAGSLGIGIYRLTYSPERGYFARFRRNGSNVLMRFSRFEGLMRLLKNHGVRMQYYVVQQGIRLIEIDSCPIDFRFHMTKNGDNEWVTSGIGAKKAGKGSVTTHVRTGGQLMTPEQVLNRVFGSRGDSVLEKAKAVAIKLANSIERNYSRPLGELGFDLGIDKNERIWMFEANAKPGRSIFKHPSLKSQGKTSLKNLIDHCMYLSRFQLRREG
ncbi:YheC/YheD family endospore coat-associated protein [Paenibacillus senegalensis]|uniref:YheC/YheD family endospore coat-associated protein n=1 Tax=Paenibacillus senegalensis TaxID=1465766 RepID=UPI0002893756|nr:YheC/YheD family protein [Paenibacillus senegalensis]